MSSISAQLPSSIRALIARGAGSALFSGLAMVFALTLSSKAISFLKDAVVLSQFGISNDLDAFLLVFGFMSFAATMLAGGLPESFLPVYVELKHRKGAKRADRMALQCAVFQLALLLTFGLLIVFGGGFLVEHLANGFDAGKKGHALYLLARLLPFMLCFGISYQLAAWLRADKRFILVASAPLLVPLTIILCLVFGGAVPDVHMLLWGTNLGAMGQCALLAGALVRRLPRNRRWWSCGLRHWEPALKTVRRNALPFLLGGIAFSSAALVDQTMASWLTAGSVTVLAYSDKLCGIILGLTAGPLADVLFPYFADQVAAKDWAGLRRRLLLSVGGILSIALPLALLLYLLAPWVVQFVFERGAFSHADTLRVANVLRYAAMQIPFYVLGIVTARVIVSLQASRIMLMISLAALCGNAALNWILMQRMGVAGIALSTVFVHFAASITSCLCCLTLIRRKEKA